MLQQFEMPVALVIIKNMDNWLAGLNFSLTEL
jgi:hypothetical protein